MKNINEAIDEIVGESMSSYGLEKEKPAPENLPIRNTGSSSPNASSAKTRRAIYHAPRKSAKPVTSQLDWQEKYPASQTPHVFNQAKVDDLLLRCRELPTPDKPIKNYAGYSREEWDKLLGVLSTYLADVAEGAGLLYKGGFSADAFRKDLSILLQVHFKHHDPYDHRNRYISVDGRIDTDERQP
jgi:hypothetical protein